MTAPTRNRAKDERDLEWIAMRRAGKTAAEIANLYGVALETVKTQTLSIRSADISHPDPRAKPAQIQRAYWDSDAMRNAGKRLSTGRKLRK